MVVGVRLLRADVRDGDGEAWGFLPFGFFWEVGYQEV